MCLRSKLSFVKNNRGGREYFKTLTTIITLSLNHHFETKTHNMSYRKAQLRRTVPTWYRKKWVNEEMVPPTSFLTTKNSVHMGGDGIYLKIWYANNLKNCNYQRDTLNDRR